MSKTFFWQGIWQGATWPVVQSIRGPHGLLLLPAFSPTKPDTATLLHLHILLHHLGVVLLHIAPSDAKYCNVSTEMQITDAQFCRNSSPPIQHFQHWHQSSHFQAVLRQIFCILWLSNLFNPAHCSAFGMENQNTISLWASANPFQKKNVLACTYACTKLDKDEPSPNKKSFRAALCFGLATRSPIFCDRASLSRHCPSRARIF